MERLPRRARFRGARPDVSRAAFPSVPRADEESAEKSAPSAMRWYAMSLSSYPNAMPTSTLSYGVTAAQSACALSAATFSPPPPRPPTRDKTPP